MASVPYKKIVEEFKKYPSRPPVAEGAPPARGLAEQALHEMIVEGVYKADDFSFKALAYEIVGRGEVEACASDRGRMFTQVLEHAGAVSTAAFKDISGQI